MLKTSQVKLRRDKVRNLKETQVLPVILGFVLLQQKRLDHSDTPQLLRRESYESNPFATLDSNTYAIMNRNLFPWDTVLQ